MPKLTRKRFAAYGFNSEKIEAKKRPFFEWDSALLQIFEACLHAYQKIEKEESTGFTPTIDLR